jgi:hypothetical protein
MKIAALVIGVLATFWLGYGFCAYRAYGLLFPILSQSRDVSNASLMIKFVDLIDGENSVALRAKLLAIAKVSSENSVPSPGYSVKSFLRGPFESIAEPMESIKQANASQLVTIRADITRLCQTSPATDTYRYVCGR